MRVARIRGCLLLIVPLLGILGCASSGYVKKGPEAKGNTVNITNCNAYPDTVRVPKNDTLSWTDIPPDGHTYVVKFNHSAPFSSHTVPTGQNQTVVGDFWCNSFGGVVTSLCVYPYELIQDGVKTCPDPGVHVVPKTN